MQVDIEIQMVGELLMVSLACRRDMMVARHTRLKNNIVTSTGSLRGRRITHPFDLIVVNVKHISREKQDNCPHAGQTQPGYICLGSQLQPLIVKLLYTKGTTNALTQSWM